MRSTSHKACAVSFYVDCSPHGKHCACVHPDCCAFAPPPNPRTTIQRRSLVNQAARSLFFPRAALSAFLHHRLGTSRDLSLILPPEIRKRVYSRSRKALRKRKPNGKRSVQGGGTKQPGKRRLRREERPVLPPSPLWMNRLWCPPPRRRIRSRKGGEKMFAVLTATYCTHSSYFLSRDRVSLLAVRESCPAPLPRVHE